MEVLQVNFSSGKFFEQLADRFYGNKTSALSSWRQYNEYGQLVGGSYTRSPFVVQKKDGTFADKGAEGFVGMFKSSAVSVGQFMNLAIRPMPSYRSRKFCICATMPQLDNQKEFEGENNNIPSR